MRGEKLLFDLRHFAGEVRYDARNWLGKNRDALLQHLELLMLQAPNAFVRDLFLPHCMANASDTARSRSRTTLSGSFRTQLGALMSTIEMCGVHHVRCVAANAEKQPEVGVPHVCTLFVSTGWLAAPQLFSPAHVITQLRQVGALEAIRVRRAGYALRRTFDAVRHASRRPPPLTRAVVAAAAAAATLRTGVPSLSRHFAAAVRTAVAPLVALVVTPARARSAFRHARSLRRSGGGSRIAARARTRALLTRRAGASQRTRRTQRHVVVCRPHQTVSVGRRRQAVGRQSERGRRCVCVCMCDV